MPPPSMLPARRISSRTWPTESTAGSIRSARDSPSNRLEQNRTTSLKSGELVRILMNTIGDLLQPYFQLSRGIFHANDLSLAQVGRERGNQIGMRGGPSSQPLD